MQQFTARLDGLSKTLTFVVLVIMIIPFITIGQMYTKNHTPSLLIAPAIVIAACVVIYLFRPTGFAIDTDAILVHRQIGDKRIPLEYIVSYVPVQVADLGFGIRTFASGGFFGYFGKFWYRKLGHVNLYATDRSKMILIRTKKGKIYIISPDDTNGFLRALQSRMVG